MRAIYIMSIAVALAASAPAAADPWKDESGHGRVPHGYHGGEWKQEWRDGPCKYERKWESSGEYKEEVKCDGYGHVHSAGPTAYVPVPVPPSVTIIVPID